MPRLDGADISHHQDDAGPIDWLTLRAASLAAWVATKATQSTTYVDPTCDTHRAQMATQGFRHRGLYHWLSSTTDPGKQAAHYLACIGTLHPGEFVMLDAEERGITAAMCLVWLEAVEAVTKRPASVYSGAYVAGGTIWQSTAIRTSKFGPRPMHLAAYTSEAKAKALPGVKAYPWSAWQYSSNGPVPGIVGRCDMNRIDNQLVYDLAAGLTFPPPISSPEDDMITINDIYKDAETQADKFVLMLNGKLRPIGQVELRILGIPLSLELGKPLSKADRDALGLYSDAVGGPDPRVDRLEVVTGQLNDAVGRTGQVVGDIQKGLGEAAAARA